MGYYMNQKSPRYPTFDLGIFNSLGLLICHGMGGWSTPLFAFRGQPLGASFINKSSWKHNKAIWLAINTHFFFFWQQVKWWYTLAKSLTKEERLLDEDYTFQTWRKKPKNMFKGHNSFQKNMPFITRNKKSQESGLLDVKITFISGSLDPTFLWSKS